MKFSAQLVCVAIVGMVTLALTVDSEFASSTAAATDEAKACNRQGAFWVLDWEIGHPTIPAMCAMHVGGQRVTSQCGHCYYPSRLDCLIAAGTWNPASANQPLGFCLLPDHSTQTNYPGSQGGGSQGTPKGGTGGIDCSNFGLISDGIGGCCLPGEGACILNPFDTKNAEKHKPAKPYLDVQNVIKHESECAKQSLVWDGNVCGTPGPHLPPPAK